MLIFAREVEGRKGEGKQEEVGGRRRGDESVISQSRGRGPNRGGRARCEVHRLEEQTNPPLRVSAAVAAFFSASPARACRRPSQKPPEMLRSHRGRKAESLQGLCPPSCRGPVCGNSGSGQQPLRHGGELGLTGIVQAPGTHHRSRQGPRHRVPHAGTEERELGTACKGPIGLSKFALPHSAGESSGSLASPPPFLNRGGGALAPCPYWGLDSCELLMERAGPS